MNKFELENIVLFVLWPVLPVLLIVMGLVFGSVMWYKNIQADGRVKYCYIQREGAEGITYYKLFGYREWTFDRSFNTYHSFDEALEGAKKLNCPLNK